MEEIPVMKTHSLSLDYLEGKRIYGNEFNKTIDYHTLRESGRADWLLIYTVAGAGCIKVSGMDKKLDPGSGCLYEPGAYQDYGTALKPGHWHFLWAHFVAPGRLLPLMDWTLWWKGIRVFQLDAGDQQGQVEEAMRRMIRYSSYPAALSDPLAFVALEEVCLLTRQKASGGRGVDARIQRAIDHLTRSYKEAFELKTLARLAGLSVSRLSSLFRAQTGSSPRDFQEKVRMEHAVSLLRLTQLPVAGVAAECGYEDALYFSKRFRLVTGASPTECRKENPP